jgi:hypothetical protein
MTISEIAAKYELTPVQVGNWKKELLENVPESSGHYGGMFVHRYLY